MERWGLQPILLLVTEDAALREAQDGARWFWDSGLLVLLGKDVKDLRCSTDGGHMAIEFMPPVVVSFRNFPHKLLSGKIRIKDAERFVEDIR